MRHWWIPALILLAACGDDNNDPSGPGITPETPATLSSTSLDGAIALMWSDNPFQNNPDIFGNYQIYGTSFDLDTGECGDRLRSWRAPRWRRSSWSARWRTASRGVSR